ncbi:MAG: CBS domain-containing protein [Candidatus Micrarchaeaceae archaeon]
MPSVATIMHKHIVGVAPETKLYTALRLTKNSAVSVLPVLKNGKLVGIITRKDIENALAKGTSDGAEVGTLMKKPVFVELDSSIDEAAEIMIKHRITRLPVVNSKKEMICNGIVSSSDVVAAKA